MCCKSSLEECTGHNFGIILRLVDFCQLREWSDCKNGRMQSTSQTSQEVVRLITSKKKPIGKFVIFLSILLSTLNKVMIGTAIYYHVIKIIKRIIQHKSKESYEHEFIHKIKLTQSLMANAEFTSKKAQVLFINDIEKKGEFALLDFYFPTFFLSKS